MEFPRKELLKDCKNKEEVEAILKMGERALKTWQDQWSEFLSVPIREEAIKVLTPLNELNYFSFGGFDGAERQRLCISRNEQFNQESIQIKGIVVTGNFFFDRAEVLDFRQSIELLGVKSGDIGDIWLNGERGAQIICSKNASEYLHNKEGMVRDVKIYCEAVETNELKPPLKRIPKRIKTVEASTRLDAIASAGFGISRARASSHIQEGRIRLNWKQTKQSTRSIEIGDKIHLDQKGSLEILHLEKTKRERWRVELLRQ